MKHRAAERGERSSAALAQQDTRSASGGVEAATLGAELVCGEARFTLTGRVLLLVLWLARRQERINGLASDAGQVWMSWKGVGGQSITGDLKTPL